MTSALADNRYMRIGPHASRYYVVKNTADKRYLELDLAAYEGLGRGNASNVTIAIGSWTDAGANAPTVVASGAGHTPSMVRVVLSGGNTGWNAGATGGYAVRQGAVPIVVTFPDTSEVKEILLVVSLVNITDVVETGGVSFDESGNRVVVVSGNLQNERIWLEPGETALVVLNLAGWLADRASGTNMTAGSVTFTAWSGNASGATAPTAGTLVLTPTTAMIPLSLAANASLGTGNGGYRGMAEVTLTLNPGANNEEIQKIQLPLATRLTA